MRRRILAAILSVTAIAITMFGVPLAIIVVRFVDEDASLRVEREAVLAARDVPGDFATSGDPVELPGSSEGIQLALYDRQGILMAGNGPRSADAVTRQALDDRVVDAEIPGARVVAVPVAANENVVGAIRAEQSTARSSARARRIVALLVVLAGGVVAVGAAIGYVVAGRLSRPVRKLRDAAVQLGEGDFSIEVPRSDVPELDEAAHALTATARRLDDLVSRERSFTADVSHQLRTPLAGLRAAIETELAFPRPRPAALLEEAIADIDRLERTVTDLLNIARATSGSDSAIATGDVLADVERHWHGPLAGVGRPLTIVWGDDAAMVYGSAANLRHALDVLVDNALRHGAGEVRIEQVVADETVTITVVDEGRGFSPPAEVEESDPTGDVHGLGLPLARRLVEAMPGRLVVGRAGHRSRIDIVLQRADSAAG